MADSDTAAVEADLEKRLADTEKLIGLHKHRQAQGFAGGEEPTASELSALTKLEMVTLPNLRAFARAREMTREP
jgi:hypothetical protein